MLIAKNDPVGVDWYINRFQAWLYERLNPVWGKVGDQVSTDQFVCYPRVYRNNGPNGYVAQHYTGGDQYNKDCYWDAGLNAVSFFGIGTAVKNGIMDQVDVHFVAFVDCKKIKPAIAHRADEEIKNELTRIIGKHNFGFKYLSTETGIENVLKEYPGSIRDKSLRTVDMQPCHAFRLNFLLTFNSKQNCK